MGHARAKSKFAQLKEAGHVPRGIFIASLDPAVTEIAGQVGYDFIIIDGEHGRFSLSDIDNHVRACKHTGLTPIVRVLENSPRLIQSVLDAGAHGIMVPHIGSGEEAKRAVDAARYAPLGSRGMCASCDAAGYQFDSWSQWSEHTHESNANILVLPIIESAAGVENIEDIAAVEGIDFVLFGAADLASDMGLLISRDFDRINAAWEHVRSVVRKADKGVMDLAGGIGGLADADILIDIPDLMILHNALRSLIQQHRAVPEDCSS